MQNNPTQRLANYVRSLKRIGIRLLDSISLDTMSPGVYLIMKGSG